MEEEDNTITILVIWRGKKLNVEISSDATVGELGHKLQNLTNVKSDTMRLFIPISSVNGSKLLIPFSDEYSSLSLQKTSILEGKSIRMMGAFDEEIEEVSRNGTKAEQRIAGFDEEERRSRQRMLGRPQTSLKFPQGTYIFCDFRTLHIPGIELNPPASEALKRMHMLAADPGIVAIMNKHRWRVGIMTEMAPVGYVGVSPKCILGFNMNHGEEISLRLRTDDLKGFRKYESIKKTLLHELAHMVYSEHDTNFYALDRQLNQEASSLDWTRSTSHTLSGFRHSDNFEEYYVGTVSNSSQKLGGKTSDQLATARASSVAAAYQRFAIASRSSSEGYVEPDPDDSLLKETMQVENPRVGIDSNCKPRRDDELRDTNKFESDCSDCQGGVEDMEVEPYSGINGNGGVVDPKTRGEPDPDYSEVSKVALKNGVMAEPDSDDSLAIEIMHNETRPRMADQEPDPDDSKTNGAILEYKNNSEPDPDDSQAIESGEDSTKVEPDPDDSLANGIKHVEPDPDESNEVPMGTSGKQADEPDPDESLANGIMHAEPDPDESNEVPMGTTGKQADEPDPDDSLANGIMHAEPDPDESNEVPMGITGMQADEPDPDDQELQRIQDPVALVCTRLQKAIEMLKSEVNPKEATSALQTLFKIIRNVIEHPDEIKFRRLRKANALFQRNVANYKAAMEVLLLVGFYEEVVHDEIGRMETYVVLKRNDPGLLWLAKSSLETCIAY